MPQASGRVAGTSSCLEALDRQTAHILNGVRACHNDIHTRKAAHRADIYHVLLRFGVAEPGGHQVFQAMYGRRGYRWLLVGFGDTQVEGGEALVHAGDVDARLQVGVVDGETLDNFHNFNS